MSHSAATWSEPPSSIVPPWRRSAQGHRLPCSRRRAGPRAAAVVHATRAVLARRQPTRYPHRAPHRPASASTAARIPGVGGRPEPGIPALAGRRHGGRPARRALGRLQQVHLEVVSDRRGWPYGLVGPPRRSRSVRAIQRRPVRCPMSVGPARAAGDTSARGTEPPGRLWRRSRVESMDDPITARPMGRWGNLPARLLVRKRRAPESTLRGPWPRCNVCETLEVGTMETIAKRPGRTGRGASLCPR